MNRQICDKRQYRELAFIVYRQTLIKKWLYASVYALGALAIFTFHASANKKRSERNAAIAEWSERGATGAKRRERLKPITPKMVLVENSLLAG